MMDIQRVFRESKLTNLPLLASQVVEGFISGIHKSPFHGYSAEFAEHKLYNTGESTRDIDWKLYAKTDKLYAKTFEEETNLRCHFILDQSASMYYPEVASPSLTQLDKLSFSALSIAAIMQLLNKQRDAVGLTVYDEELRFQATEKGSGLHYNRIYNALEECINTPQPGLKTNTYQFLHEIAEKLKRRSLIFLFTDLLQPELPRADLFEALRHLKYNKHQVVLFHTLDHKTEVNFEFDETPKRFFDMETGAKIDLHTHQIQKAYAEQMTEFIREVKLTCAQYKIRYVEADIRGDFEKILSAYLVEKQKLKS